MPASSASFQLVLLRALLGWYFVRRPVAIVRLYLDYMRTFFAIFSIFFLLKTLFAPWKAILDAYPSRGFNLAEIAATFGLNIVSRLIGAVVRGATILIGIIVQCACFVFFLLYLLVWIAFPIVFIAGCGFALLSLR